MSDNYDNYINLDGWWNEFTGDMDAPEGFPYLSEPSQQGQIESIIKDPESGLLYTLYSVPRPTGRMITWYRAYPECPWENIPGYVPSFVFDSDNYHY
jgi:hypothetical protein